MSDYKVSIREGVAYVSKWNPDIRAREEKKKEEQVLSDILQFPIEIENTTFGQFFEFIIREADLFQRIFKAAMYGHPLGPYIDELRKPDGNPENVEHVEVYWFAQRFEGELELGPGFHGWGKYEPQVGIPEMPEKGGYAIEFTGLDEYKMLPLKLDTKADFYSLEDGGKKLMDGTLEFTAYDVIRAILFEITWAGDISKGRKTCPVCDDKHTCDLHKKKDGK